MSQEFAIKGESGKRAIFDSPRFRADGWLELYRLTLESPKMSATVEVDNQPWFSPLNEYLQDLADHWDGWEGTRRWQAGEGEFLVEGTFSKRGHVFLRITMNVYGSPSDWVASAEFDIESGQLDELARSAQKFFKPSGSSR